MKALTLLMLLLLTSCLPSFEKTSLQFDDGKISLKPLIEKDEAVTFAVLKEKLLVPHCLGCHKKMGEEANLSKWVMAGMVEESALYRVIKDGSMPKKAAPLDSRYLDLVIQYIESVKKPVIIPPTPPVVEPEAAVDFQMIKKQILVPHCLECHEEFEVESGLLEEITPGKPESSDFYNEIANGTMPLQPPLLGEKEKELVRKYILSLKVD